MKQGQKIWVFIDETMNLAYCNLAKLIVGTLQPQNPNVYYLHRILG